MCIDVRVCLCWHGSRDDFLSLLQAYTGFSIRFEEALQKGSKPESVTHILKTYRDRIGARSDSTRFRPVNLPSVFGIWEPDELDLRIEIAEERSKY